MAALLPHRAGDLSPLEVLAQGPHSFTTDGRLMTQLLRVPSERLVSGPLGARLEVVVLDSSGRRENQVLGDGDWGARDLGIPNPEDLPRDRRFLAQQAYGVAADTLESVERALGRRMGWASAGRLRLYANDPIDYRNTGYTRSDCSIRFGLIEDSRHAEKLPLVLYRDLVAHEVAHAVIDGYRPRWADALAGADQLALHEALADLLAMLGVFTAVPVVEGIIAGQLKASGATLESIDSTLLASGLFRFADNLFSRGGAGRSPMSGSPPADWRSDTEPHRRAAGAVHAVLGTVLRLWRAELGRPGRRASVYQVAAAGSRIGERLLNMLLRGLAYMPPVDVLWEDLLRGILAADAVVVPRDEHNYRGTLRACFAEVGIVAGADGTLDGLFGLGELNYPVRLSALVSDSDEVLRFIWDNPRLMDAAKLDPAGRIVLDRVRPSQRISPDGFAVSEIEVSFVQELRLDAAAARKRGLRSRSAVVLRGGGLLRFDEGGRLAFSALKPVLDVQRQQELLDGAADARLAARRIGASLFHPAAETQPHGR
ncbi:hypothetical protein [Paeniglutamicibacter psychrophenolicus]|uniref:hypothetical protein n=1 Tax=Paeniglutamicibacter psychrophenolicus TaxID=257454 RepID=UPI0027881504|nr:hypothetical protein [Paeniglutamicibacter psychrophenolicus]MDQ0095391.1 hypothetical protein [Paeniglutamicibacter psychrophenolicus]